MELVEEGVHGPVFGVVVDNVFYLDVGVPRPPGPEGAVEVSDQLIFVMYQVTHRAHRGTRTRWSGRA